MTAAGVRVGDRVKVERITYSGHVESYSRGAGGLGKVGGRPAEMVVRTAEGHAHYFDPDDSEVLVTILQPTFKAGQVWETPDGAHWFIRSAATATAKTEFYAVSTSNVGSCFTQTSFIQKLPRLIFPVGA